MCGALVTGAFAMAAAGLHPTVLPASGDSSRSITIFNTVAGRHAVSVGLWRWTGGILLAIGYFVLVYRMSDRESRNISLNHDVEQPQTYARDSSSQIQTAGDAGSLRGGPSCNASHAPRNRPAACRNHAERRPRGSRGASRPRGWRKDAGRRFHTYAGAVGRPQGDRRGPSSDLSE